MTPAMEGTTGLSEVGGRAGSTIRTLLHGKINPKDWQVVSLGDVGFLLFLRVVSGDYGKPCRNVSTGWKNKCDTGINLYQVLPFVTHLGVLFKWPFQGLRCSVTSIWGIKGALERSWYCLFKMIFFISILFPKMVNHHEKPTMWGILVFFPTTKQANLRCPCFFFEEFHGRFIYRVFGANICVCDAATHPAFFQIFYIFTPIWGTFPFWRIFFRWVGSTTN